MDASAQQYLAFVFTESWVAAALWQKSGARISVLLQPDPTPFASSQIRDLTQALETSLDDLGEAGLSIKNVLLAVPRDWINDNDLNTDAKRLLKQLSQDLLLQPLGYVVVSDAVVAAEQSTLGASFTGIIISQSEHHVYATLYTDGVESQHEKIGKSGNWEQDAQEVSARFTTQPSGSRVLLLEHPDTSMQQSLESALQTKGLNPELISTQHTVQSAITIGGDEVLKAQSGDTPPAPAKAEAAPAAKHETPAVDGFAPVDFGQPIEHDLPASDDDDALDNLQPVPDDTEVGDPGIDSGAGFVIHGATLDELEPHEAAESSETDEPETPTKHPGKKRRFRLNLPGVPFGPLPKLLARRTGKLAFGAVALILLALIGVGFITQTYRVTVTAQLATQEVSREVVFPVTVGEALVENESDDTETTSTAAAETTTQSLPGELIIKSVTLNKEVTTTGTNVTGDPAKGMVTLYNKTSQNKLFPSGTRLTAGTTVFTLDQDFQVASAETSENQDSRTTKFGTTDAAVTAAAIGPAGNIAKDTTFSVANFDNSSYEAKSIADFSGGTEREIQVVAKRDVDDAAKQMRSEAADQLKGDLEAETNDSQIVLPLEGTTVTEIIPSVQVGEEAKLVQVTVTVESQGIALQREKALELAQTLLAQEGNTQHELLSETVVFEPLQVDPAGDTQVLLKAKLAGQRVPQLQASQLHEQLAGENLSRVNTVLSQHEAIESHTIVFQPNWVQWIWPYLPSNTQRVQYNLRISRSL